jgi:hypothetical protein
MRVHVVSAASFVLVAAACGSHHETSAPDASFIQIGSAVPATAVFGQRIPISVLVSSADGSPRNDAPVIFSATDEGVVDPAFTRSDSHGIASTVWKLSDVNPLQTLGAQPDDGKAITVTVTATNAWSSTSDTYPAATARFADDTLPGTSITWASTALGSPPQLLIACEYPTDAGVVFLALTHPRLQATRSTVTWTLDGREPVTEEWDTWQTHGLKYPWVLDTPALVGWIAAANAFTVRFHDANTNADYTARFGSVGLRRTSPLVIARCAPPGPWDY